MSRSSCIVRFDWRHDRVSAGHIAVRVSGQEKEVLRLMVESDGRVCEREALMEVVWGKRAIHMDELYLTQLVYRLRKSLRPLGLGEHIVTMPRAGYRFDPGGLQIHAEDTLRDEASASNGEAVEDKPVSQSTALRDWFGRGRPTASGQPASSETAVLPAIHTEEGLVTHAGATVHLTGFERALLQAFVEQPDVTLERHELISRIWGDEENVDVNRLTRLVSRLRRSLQPLGLDQQLLYIPCVGYRFCRTAPTATVGVDVGAGEAGGRLRPALVVARRWLPRAVDVRPWLSRAIDARRWIAPRLGSRRTVMLIGLVMIAFTGALAMPAGLGNACRPARTVEALHMGSATSTTCSPDFVHRVFIRDVVDSVAASSSPSVPATLDNAWQRIVVDLHAAGCRSVTP